MRPLAPRDELEQSEIVANSRMNRERGCIGPNSYARELGFSPLEFLQARLRAQERVAWLDLCCGRGRALIDAARCFADQGASARVTLVGIDLVPLFEPTLPALESLRLEVASATAWEPGQSFDLITCVHGLHYVGDKLGLILRAVSWLTSDGLFVAHLDLGNLKLEGSAGAGRQMLRDLRTRGFAYDSRRRLLRRKGRGEIRLGYGYLGADDAAGPNYTGQPAVDSYCRIHRASAICARGRPAIEWKSHNALQSNPRFRR